MGYWLAGKWQDATEIILAVNDPSLLYGATIFTTLRIFQSDLTHPNSHWLAHGDRLRNTVEMMRWAQPNWDDIEQGARQVAQHYPVVRVTVLSDGRELITGRSLPDRLTEKQQQGVQAWLATDGMYRRPMADFKTGNYLGAWRALREAIAQGAGEAILLSENGAWLETATGNLWGFDGENWHTPPLSGILPGVMRSHLMQQLKLQGHTVSEAPWTMALIKKFEAIAYSNSVVGVIPFTTIFPTDLPNLEIHLPVLRNLQKLSGCCDSFSGSSRGFC